MAYEKKKTVTSWQVKDSYNKKAYDRIGVTIPKGDKDKIRLFAEAKGLSVNAFIVSAIKEAMGEKE